MICRHCQQPIPDGRPPEQCPSCLLARAKATSVDGSGGENFGNAGPYLLTGKLGEGAFGEVFFGEQNEPIYREAAVKLLKRGLLGDPASISRFRAEAQALTLLDHPNIARLYEAGTTSEGQPFIALELISGTPITDWCAARELSTEEKLTLFKKVCAALQHAHDKGLVHRDLKPENILVDLESEEPKVIDFGIVRSTTSLLQKDAMLTGTLDIIGTPAYLSPEQTDGGSENIDARSDIYALGIVLYELLTRRTPVDSKTNSHFELLRAIRETPTEPPSTIDPSIAPSLDAAVLKALAKDRDDRFQTANELLVALEAGNLQSAPVAKPKNRTTILALAGIVLAATWIIFALWPTAPSPTKTSKNGVEKAPEPTALSGYLPPFTLVAHDFQNVSEGTPVTPPFSSESKFNWFHFHDSHQKDLIFATDSEYKSNSAGLFVIGAKSADLPGAESVVEGSAIDQALLQLLESEIARLPKEEWDRLDALAFDQIRGDSKTRQRKLFLERYQSLIERRRNRQYQ